MRFLFLKYQGFLLLFLLFFLSVHAQREITTTEVLLGAKNIEQVKFDSIQLAFLKDYNHNLPLVNSVEFRSETRDFLLSRQEYAIRVKPNSLRAVLAKKKVYTAMINEVELQGRINFNEELEDRYYLLIDYLFNEKLLAAYRSKKVQLEDELATLEHSIYDDAFNVRDVVEAEEALFDTEVILRNLEDTKAYQNEILRLMVFESTDSISLSNHDLITPDQILAIPLDGVVSKDNLEIQLRQSKLEAIDGELSFDVAKSKKIIDFVQARYRSRDNGLFDEDFSIGVGINLPFFGNTREKKSEHYFNKLRTESEILSLKKEQEQKTNKAQENFKRTTSKYTILKDQVSKSSVNALLDTYKKMEGVSPLILLKLKVSQKNKKIDIIKLEHELYDRFIKMLAAKNMLFQTPAVNFLTRNSSLIE